MARAWRRPEEEDKDFLDSDTSTASSNSGYEGSFRRKQPNSNRVTLPEWMKLYGQNPTFITGSARNRSEKKPKPVFEQRPDTCMLENLISVWEKKQKSDLLRWIPSERCHRCEWVLNVTLLQWIWEIWPTPQIRKTLSLFLPSSLLIIMILIELKSEPASHGWWPKPSVQVGGVFLFLQHHLCLLIWFPMCCTECIWYQL